MKKLICEHLEAGKRKYIFIFLLMIVGFVCGLVMNKKLPPEDTVYLRELMDTFFSENVYGSEPSQQNFIKYFLEEIKIYALIWLGGMAGISYIAAPVFIFIRSISFGFTVGFMVETYELKGLFYMLIFFIPEIIFNIPALCFSGVSSLSLHIKEGSLTSSSRATLNSKRDTYTAFTVCMIIALLIAMLGAAVRSFITDNILTFLSESMV